MTVPDLQMRHAISLSVKEARWMDQRLSAGPFETPQDYLAELVRLDRSHHENRLGHLLDEAELSGISRRSLDDIFSVARHRVKADV